MHATGLSLGPKDMKGLRRDLRHVRQPYRRHLHMRQSSIIFQLTEGIAETGTEPIARLRRTPNPPGMLTREVISQQCGGIIVLTQQQTPVHLTGHDPRQR
ncbi:hypothetical protein, partial [Pseudoalteromonas sp. SIMBA_162]|uniref:hypothetical protein n=1 Tax=Pseudoalteromonas sp. SIMBA_162 TaxID=3080867 RepID=UPI00397BB46B